MIADKLKISLTAKPDRKGQTFYVGALKYPGTIDCKDGVVFLVFTSEEGNEEIQIAAMEPHDREVHGDVPRTNSDRPQKPNRDGNYDR